MVAAMFNCNRSDENRDKVANTLPIKDTFNEVKLNAAQRSDRSKLVSTDVQYPRSLEFKSAYCSSLSC